MKQVFRVGVLFVALTSGATLAFGQVPFAFEWNVQEPEEVEGWDGDAIRIVYDGVGNSQQGVTFDNVATGDYSKLEFDFEFRFLNDTPEGIADGIGFTYANVDFFGESAEDDVFPNYSGEEPNLQGSIGVGFDTWMNAALDDPDAGATYPDATLPNSFSLHYDNQLLLTVPMAGYDLPDDWLETPSVKRAHIEIVPGDDEAFVTVQVTDTESGQSVTAFDNEIVPFFTPYAGRMTFRARTGGEWADTDLDNISLTLVEPNGTRQDPIVHYGRHVGPGDGPGPRGDFNNDGILDAADIDALTAQSASGQNNAAYDLTGDSVVDGDDVNEWISATDIYNSYSGDANLDKEFSSGDLVTVLSAGKYELNEVAVWTQGDFNGDGRFDSGDLVTALSGGGYEIGMKPAVAAVPEPCSAVLLLTGCLWVGRRRRR